MKRLLSGIKPTGEIHIGNYFGAMRQFLDLQNEYDNFIFVADYHALNQTQDPEKIKKTTLEVAKAYLAIGLDPAKVTLFKQSDVPEVTELCWIFNCITPIAELQRAHAYKDAVAKKKPINMGLFDYPVLMAADILMYNSDVVPVGQDQKQHLEIAQGIAQKFNKIFGETFKVPQELILKDVAVIKGLDGQKMSKSYNNAIGLFDSSEVVKKKVMSVKTDSKGADEVKDPETCNIFALHKLFLSDKDLSILVKRYHEGKISYKESKEMLFEEMEKFLQPIRTKKAKLDEDDEYVIKVLEAGAKKAKEFAKIKMEEIRKKVGVR